jgi:cellulose synthase (UDP-forming)
MVTLELEVGQDHVALPAEVLRWQEGRLQVRFAPQDLRDEGQIVRAVLGRADAWVGWDSIRSDRPLRSLKEVALSIGGLFRGGSQFTLGGRQDDGRGGSGRGTGGGAPPAAPASPANQARAAANRAGLGRRAAAVLLALGLTAAPAFAQRRPAPAPAADAPAAAPAPAATPAPTPVLGGGAVFGQDGGPNARRVSQTFRQLGLKAPMQLRGTSDLQGVLFGVRGDEVVTSARLVLQGATSPALIQELSQIAVTLNEQFIGAVTPDRSRPSFGPIEFPINPVYFADNNRLNFRFSGRYAVECNDPLSGLLWATISDQSAIHLTLERLPLTRDLARLPEPFFDYRVLREPLTLPFVVPDNAGNDALRAAATAASFFAVAADYRGASFPVSASVPDRGNAVVIATGIDAVPGVTLPRFDGPTLALVPNPNDASGVFLVVGGRSGGEAATAAAALAVGRQSLSGELAVVQTPNLPPRQPYDAPRWLRTDRPVRLGELLDPSELQAFGYAPGAVAVPFRTAPDLYTWRNRPFEADIRFRAPPGPVTDVAASRLDIALNDVYLRSFPLRQADASWPWSWIGRQLGRNDRAEGRVGLPPWMVFGQNELQLRFDMRPLSRGDCIAVPGDIRASVDPDSSIDLSSAHRFATLPNLAHFASSGFPYSVLADLSGTAAVLPERPSSLEISAFLGLIGRISAVIGHPATGLTVVRPGALEQVADRDLIVVGALGRQPALAQLLRDNPINVEGNRLSVALPDALDSIRYVFGAPDRRTAREQVSATLAAPGEGLGALIAFESPLRSGKSVVALTGSSPAGMEALVTALRDPEQISRVQGDMTLLSGGQVRSYRIGGSYTRGTLPPWLWPQYWMANQPLLVLGVMVLAVLLVAGPLYWVLRRRAALRLRERTH